MNSKIFINLLGKFEIKFNNKIIVSETTNNPKKMWVFLVYISTFRNKYVSIEDLAEALWKNKEYKNPYNALKTILYRLRIFLENSDPSFPKDFLILKNNTFIWNRDINIEFDFSVFEDLCSKTFSDKYNADEKLAFSFDAFDMYNGDFLQNFLIYDWVIPINSYYHTIYIQLVNYLISLLEEKKDYKNIILVCEKAVLIERYEENLYKKLISSLCKMNETKCALEKYNYVTKLFYDELGLNVSNDFKNIYNEIIKISPNKKNNIEYILLNLNNTINKDKVYFCEYAIFKEFYNLILKTNLRYNTYSYISLVSITNYKNLIPPANLLSEYMKNLLYILDTNLRKNDIVSRYSKSQYIIILLVTKGSALKVMERILKTYKKTFPKDNIQINYSIKQINSK